ncbi:hypothetical protein KY311_00570 [Candidatus Woesearchaeota archaeon]|nr:hypothetical protein [Candidatus Woesearchaeota archaeon]MBW3017145.1 hypothetical protein [Candidatus Woesearchaeota archaeon]
MKLKEALIQFVGLNDLKEDEQEIVKKLSSEYHDKIQRAMETPTSLVVTIKLHNTEGKRKKFSIKVKTLAAKRTVETKHAADWDLERTLHKAFKNMERLVLHEFRADSQHKKTY